MFLLYLILPILGWTCYLRSWRSRLHPAAFFLLLCLAGYLLYVGGVAIADWELQQSLSAFDLNGDGEFSAAEFTPEAKAVMQRFAGDTGRTLALVVAAPVTLIWVSLGFVFVVFLPRVCRKMWRGFCCTGSA